MTNLHFRPTQSQYNLNLISIQFKIELMINFEAETKRNINIESLKTMIYIPDYLFRTLHCKYCHWIYQFRSTEWLLNF
jgi:hypothetical protein